MKSQMDYTYPEGFIDGFRVVAMMCGLMLSSTCVMASVCGVVVFGEIGLFPRLLPVTYPREHLRSLSWLSKHDGTRHTLFRQVVYVRKFIGTKV